MTTPTITPAPGTTGPGGGGVPPLTAHWFLPTYGDSRGLVGGGHGMAAAAAGTPREASLGYLAQIARAAETVGFEGALTQTGAWRARHPRRRADPHRGRRAGARARPGPADLLRRLLARRG